jgi:pyruvate-formate lyase
LTDLTHLGARYILWHVLAEAVSNAADAAMAIKKFVFEEKLLTLPQLVEILKNDWAGAEELRYKFLTGAPKWGNGNEEVDSIAREMTDYFIERVEYHAKSYPRIIFSPSIATFSWVISIGKRIGASADGRNAQELIAANLSPAPGRDTNGPTAAINSYLKINTSPMAAGAPIDLRVNMNGLEGEEGTRRISALIKTFLDLGGNMMTLTITSAEELRQAIEHPENYRGLRVRMGGWSAYFTLLSKESQMLHLKRVEHNL